MAEIVLFGGTQEGRELCGALGKKQISTLACVATPYGQSLLPPSASLRTHTGRLDRGAMETLLQAENPRLVIDATHPYAALVSDNLRAACEKTGHTLIRLVRAAAEGEGCRLFSRMEELVSWLNTQPGTVFSSLGAKEASALTGVQGYQKRVWLRILPDENGLGACLAAGFLAKQIICMQGPFSRELNAAMFRQSGANILLTKESGEAGGYPEKLEAALECGMTAAVLARPRVEAGLSLGAVLRQIGEGTL